ncbi:MAG TPA: hypothetical protein P5556_11075 [Candidatus Gastranaerophilales bacterium]|nr:hypothetical protein [Candidatus Gastranaerophilales bacterium]
MKKPLVLLFSCFVLPLFISGCGVFNVVKFPLNQEDDLKTSETLRYKNGTILIRENKSTTSEADFLKSFNSGASNKDVKVEPDEVKFGPQ